MVFLLDLLLQLKITKMSRNDKNRTCRKKFRTLQVMALLFVLHRDLSIEHTFTALSTFFGPT